MVDTVIGAFPEEKRTPRYDGSKIINVAECFRNTIQGENFGGFPATFLRLQRCTLNCSWCFHPNTQVNTIKGMKKIKDIKAGEQLITIDPATSQPVITTVKEPMQRQVSTDDMMRVVVGKDDKPIICTKNHQFFVKHKGWVEAQDLEEGDILIHLSGSQFKTWKMQNENPMFNEEYKQKSVDGHTYEPYKRTEKHRQLQSELKKGDMNPMKDAETAKKNAESHSYKQSGLEKQYEEYFRNKTIPITYIGNTDLAIGDAESRYRFPDFVVDGKKKVIEVYDTTKKYKKNGEWKPRDEQYMFDTKTHYEKFGYQVLFLTEQDIKDPVTLHANITSFIYNGDIVKSVGGFNDKQFIASFGTLKTEQTTVHNLSCEPYNTYLVQGCLVHNCDTSEVWRHGNPYSTWELAEIFEKEGVIDDLKKGHHLILTGGSPLLQQDALIELIDIIQEKYRFKPFIEIENECVLAPREEMLEYVNLWNNSPKLSTSGNKDKFRYKPEAISVYKGMDNAFYKFVVTSEEDWKEIQEDFIDAGLVEKKQVVLMPEGASRKELQEKYDFVIDLCCRESVRFSDRMQVTAWDMTTGV